MPTESSPKLHNVHVISLIWSAQTTLWIFGWAGNIVAEQASKVMIVENNSTTYKFCTNPTVKPFAVYGTG